MDKRLIGLLMGILMTLNASVTQATPITYQLQGVFDDGATLGGSFEWNSALKVFGFVAITTSAASPFSGNIYATVSLHGYSSISGEGELSFIGLTSSGGDILNLNFLNRLWTGNTSSLLRIGGNVSFEKNAFPAQRNLISGEVSAAVPEPTALVLMGLGLSGIGYRVRQLMKA